MAILYVTFSRAQLPILLQLHFIVVLFVYPSCLSDCVALCHILLLWKLLERRIVIRWSLIVIYKGFYKKVVYDCLFQNVTLTMDCMCCKKRLRAGLFVDLTLWPIKWGAVLMGCVSWVRNCCGIVRTFLGNCKLFWRCYVVFGVTGVMRLVLSALWFSNATVECRKLICFCPPVKTDVGSLETANIVRCWGRREIQLPKRSDLFGIGILDDAQRPETQQLAGNLLGAENNGEKCIYRNELYTSNLF